MLRCKRCRNEVRRARALETFLAYPLAFLTLRKHTYYVHKSHAGPYYGKFKCPKRFLTPQEVEESL